VARRVGARCPVCKGRVIDFLVWSQGNNAFRKLDCPHCEAHLRVSRRTTVVFMLLLGLTLPLAIVVAESMNALGVPEPTARVFFGCLIIPLAGVGAYFAWRTGFYAIRDNAQPKTAGEHPNDVATSGPGSLRLLFVAGLAAGPMALIITIGHRDLLLTFDKQMTKGRITEVHQPPPGAIRLSDYRVKYEFESESGLVYSGEDVLPPAHPPAEDGRILVVFSRRDPAVSRIESQSSGTPVAGVLLGAGLLLWSVAQFVRLRRQSISHEQRNSGHTGIYG
jgi:hypothetical protein